MPRPGLSTVFSPSRSTFGVDLLVAHTDVYLDGQVHSERLTAQEIVKALQVPLVDPTDIGATVLSRTVLSQPVQTLDSLRAARHGALDSEGIDLSESVELPLMEVRALLDLGDVAKATRKLDDLADRVGWSWRLAWFRAVSAMLSSDYDSATKHFTEVLDTLPGELAPKLALAATAELAGLMSMKRPSASSTTRCGPPTTASSRRASGWPARNRRQATATARCGRLTRCRSCQGISRPRG